MPKLEVLAYRESPDLKRVFASALLHVRRSGETLPQVRAEQLGALVDPTRVADYAHLCGFTLGAHPPVTYPHLLGFPLQAAVIAHHGFPLPLVGLVHVRNTITWTRPFAYGERIDVRVRAEALRPHRRGRLVDLVTEITSSGVGGPPVWTGVSTYLARGAGSGDVETDSPPDVAGLQDPGGRTFRFAEGDGRRYAAVSGDVNPIHLHALTAKLLGFDRAIAHGMFSYARVLGALDTRVPSAGTSTVWFRKPVTLPSTALLRVSGAEDGSMLAALFPTRGAGEHLVTTVAPTTSD